MIFRKYDYLDINIVYFDNSYTNFIMIPIFGHNKKLKQNHSNHVIIISINIAYTR